MSLITKINNISETIWFDKTNPSLFYVRVNTVSATTNLSTVTWTDISGAVATPILANLAQMSASSDYEIVETKYTAINAGTGYSIDNIISEQQIFNTGTGTLVNTIWTNKTLNTVLSSAPTFSDLYLIEETLSSIGATGLNKYTDFRNTALSNTVVTVKSSVGNIYGYKFVNLDQSNTAYVKFFDAATVTLGTTAPKSVIVCPPNTVTEFEPTAVPYRYFQTNSIKLVAVSGISDSNTTAPSTPIYSEIIYI